ncbi:Hypothetical predicted protein [Pelobates cultripes]|uniref:Uncharacterized protein n=1 Tax=Pelobates cultripes TaxID=61616 RepID=A0AAD1SEV2_PELCU|nr:Hypothetical predicted protein [Pelobates cultripes]
MNKRNRTPNTSSGINPKCSTRPQLISFRLSNPQFSELWSLETSERDITEALLAQGATNSPICKAALKHMEKATLNRRTSKGKKQIDGRAPHKVLSKGTASIRWTSSTHSLLQPRNIR